MRLTATVRYLLLSFLFLAFSHAAFGQIGISVGFGPPPIPVYEQPICPQDGYLWTPGYWAYADDGGYYWVPGTWVEPPQVNFLWTPGYWGWGGNAYMFHEGYWGPQVGFYGGINYGFGYGGNGYEGGRWEGNRFAYNTYVNRVNTTVIRNTYNTRIENVSENRVSYNGGNGGVYARANSQQEAYSHERHVGPVESQNRHVQEARGNPELRASQNQGRPAIAATSRPSDFKTGVEASSRAGGEYKAPPANEARGNESKPVTESRPGAEGGKPAAESRPAGAGPARPATESLPDRPSKPAANTNHAAEVQPHTFTPPNTGKTATDQKYQQQQDKLAAKQTQDHQKLQQRQETEHQQATSKNYNDAQKQQQEQRHTQQTQQMEQKHTTQQKQMEQHQAPKNAPPKPSGHPDK